MKNLIYLGLAYCLANFAYADLVLNTDGNAFKVDLNGKQLFNIKVPEISAKNIPQLNVPYEQLPTPSRITPPFPQVQLEFVIEHQVLPNSRVNRLEYSPFYLSNQLVLQDDIQQELSSSFYDTLSDWSSSQTEQTPLKEKIEQIGKTLVKELRSTVNQLVEKKHKLEEKLRK